MSGAEVRIDSAKSGGGRLRPKNTRRNHDHANQAAEVNFDHRIAYGKASLLYFEPKSLFLQRKIDRRVEI